jgi:PAS domain S-box-containing protein
MYQLFGISEGEVKPEVYIGAAVAEDKELATQIANNIRAGILPLPKTVCINVDGHKRVLKIEAAVISNAEGVPSRMIGVDMDISGAREAAKTLSEQNHFIKSINEALPDILYVLDLNTREILYINHSFQERLGYSHESEAQKNILHLLFEEDVPDMLRHLEEMKSTPDDLVCEIEYRLTAANGDIHWFRDRNSVFKRNKQGIAIEKIGIAQDVTARKRGEQELKESNTALRYANENLQQFASIASHDLQEPLRKLKMFASVLKRYEKELPEEAKEVIQKISLTSGRMRQLIDEVLQYSKVAYGKREFVPTSLHYILQNVLSDLDLLLADTDAKIQYKDPLPEIDAIPPQINQLFYNLLANALKFRKDGIQPVVLISYRSLPSEEVKSHQELDANKPHIEILFSDNGVGFNPMYTEQIFQLFERLYSVNEFEGTGVGLALCKKIVENHKGHIYARSMDGEGAHFYILLPVHQSNSTRI